MELKETKHLPTTTEIEVATPTERNNSEGQKIYNLLFPLAEEQADASVDDKYTENNYQKPKFGDVSTLDWLKTWRSTQMSQASSSDPGK